jgi:hypothetical protein
MISPPCKDCLKRKAKCHSTCEEYKAWKIEKDRLNKIVWKKKEIEAGFIEIRVKQCEKTRRMKRR